MAHEHAQDNSAGSSRRLMVGFALTAGFMLVEFVAGTLTGSLALIADAGHMLADAAALALALWAVRMAWRPADARRSYGYHRMQVLAAFVNALSLIAIALWIVVEALRRLFDPVPVMAAPMLGVAVAGLVVNLLAFAVLHGGHEHDLNRRAAALHVLADLLGSAAAIAAALIMLTTGWWPADPLLSLLTAVMIGRGGWKLARRSAHVLLEGAPEALEPAQVRRAVMDEVPGIDDVHHVHSWELKPGMPVMTLHVALTAGTDPDHALHAVHAVLERRFECSHATVQLEHGACPDANHRDPGSPRAGQARGDGA